MTSRDKIWMKSMEYCSKCCHQMPERSFFIHGYQMPVCSRCFGMIIGHICGLIGAFHLNIPMPICILLLFPLILDGTLQYKTSYVSNNLKRVITGICFGFSVVYLLIRLIISLL